MWIITIIKFYLLYIVVCYGKKVLIACFITTLHNGHSLIFCAQFLQHIKCLHGTKTTLISSSIQIRQFLIPSDLGLVSGIPDVSELFLVSDIVPCCFMHNDEVGGPVQFSPIVLITGSGFGNFCALARPFSSKPTYCPMYCWNPFYLKCIHTSTWMRSNLQEFNIS